MVRILIILYVFFVFFSSAKNNPQNKQIFSVVASIDNYFQTPLLTIIKHFLFEKQLV